MTRWIRALIIGLLLLCPGLGHAQPIIATIAPDTIRLPVQNGKGLRVTRLSTQDGLSQTRVAQIVQDARGYIWMGTQFGLDRYNGNAFKVFAHDPARPDSLSGMFVTALFADARGAVWVGTPEALDRFDARTESFTHFDIGRDTPGGARPTIVHISQDKAGHLWLSTGTGLFRFDPDSASIARFHHDPADPDSLSSDDVRWSGQDREGGLWVGTTAGLEQIDPGTGRVLLRVVLPDPVQISLYEDKAGNFWIYHASGDGLALLDRKTATVQPYSFYPTPAVPTELTGVMGMTEDDRGALWLGSPGLGLLQFDKAKGQFRHFPYRASDPNSEPEDKVIVLFKDREGSIWAGHHSTGPSHFNPSPPVFQTFGHDDNDPNSLETNFVNAIFEDRSGDLWIGTDFSLTRINRDTGQYTRFKEGLGQKPMIITIVQDTAGAIWVGTYGNGMARLDPATGRFQTYRHDPADPTSLCNDQVHRLFVTRDGTLWAGTDDGLARFDAATGRFTTFKANGADSRAQAYVSVSEDATGVLWLGTHYSGLHRLDPRTGQIEVFKADAKAPGSLRDNMVPAVHVDTTGKIWVGTQGGLQSFDPVKQVFTAYDSASGATGRTISRILEDRSGRLWMSSNDGLLRFDPKDGSLATYTTVDGLPGNDLTGWSAAYQSPSGEMFFGGFSGGIGFFPDQLVDNTPAPAVVLGDLRFPFLSDAEARALTGGTAPDFLHDLTLPASANSFVIDFAALSFLNPEANRYRFRLEGLDDRWREAGLHQRSATYTTLPPGHYVFRVEGASARGGWGEPGAALGIRVLPEWWSTWWFRAAVAVMTLGLVYAAYRIRVTQIEERESNFRKLAENSPDMVMRIYPDLRLCYANPAAEAFLGRPSGALNGVGLTALPPTMLPVRISMIEEALRSGQAISEEIELDRPEGVVSLECRVVAEPARTQSERTILVIARDITARIRSDAALRKSEADLAHLTRVVAVSELTTSIAHEINQPLTAIVTNGEAAQRWLQRDPPELPQVAASIVRVVQDGRRAAAIIDRIRNMVRRVDMQKQSVNLHDAILEIVPLVEGALKRGAIDLRLDLGADLPVVQGDQVQIQQVFLNILKNAAEALTEVAEGARRITVGALHSGDQVEVTIADTGPGLARPDGGDVFEAFFTTKPQGMGMGLTISRSIMLAHRGALWSTPNTPKGTVFHIRFPVAAA
ncbi:PAS domain-containing protein [bacterium]|nr:PAS domain-containing protein [bacterium]